MIWQHLLVASQIKFSYYTLHHLLPHLHLFTPLIYTTVSLPPWTERKKSFLIELPEETMMLQCTSKADMEDWVRDTNRLRGGRVDLASGQNIGGHLPGHDIYEGRGKIKFCVMMFAWRHSINVKVAKFCC